MNLNPDGTLVYSSLLSPFQFLSIGVPVNSGSRNHPHFKSSNTFHPLSAVGSIIFPQTSFFANYFPLFSICFFHTLSSSHHKIQCHSKRIVFSCFQHMLKPSRCSVVISVDVVKPSIVINSLVFFMSFSFTLHMAIRYLFVLLKRATFL